MISQVEFWLCPGIESLSVFLLKGTSLGAGPIRSRWLFALCLWIVGTSPFPYGIGVLVSWWPTFLNIPDCLWHVVYFLCKLFLSVRYVVMFLVELYQVNLGRCGPKKWVSSAVLPKLTRRRWSVVPLPSVDRGQLWGRLALCRSWPSLIMASLGSATCAKWITVSLCVP